MDGIATHKSWDKIGRDIRRKAPFVYHYQDKLPRTYFNHVLPNDMDQFKYAILNEFTVAGVEALTFTAPRQEIADINVQYGGRLRQAINNVNVSTSYHPFFAQAEFITGSQVYDGTYFLSSTDDHTPLIIEGATNPRRKAYRVKLNAGYSHLSVDAMTVLLLYETNTEFSKEKHKALTKEDKLRGLLMVTEYIHYHYQGRRQMGEEMFARFKRKYGFSQQIDFHEVYRLQLAIDNNSPGKDTLKAKILKDIR